MGMFGSKIANIAKDVGGTGAVSKGGKSSLTSTVAKVATKATGKATGKAVPKKTILKKV